jgi:di/tripeptidase
MEDRKLQRLKEVLSIPTHSRNEKLMVSYLQNVLTEKGFEHYTDAIGNIYVTKGKAEWYPCFVSHTDTVHSVNLNLKVVQLEENGKTILTGIDKETMKPSGIGGDDKCGVFLCLEMLDTLDNVKAAFFVSEEIGCVGSRQADPEFFKNVGYAIQYDSPEGNSMSLTLMGKKLFNEKSEFGNKVGNLILEHGIDSWERHPYTDIWPLMEKFGFSCLNLAAGYHSYHTANEYVVVDEVENGFQLGLRLHEILGENFYERVEEPVTNYGNDSYWSSSTTQKSESSKTLLKEELFFDEDEEDDDDFFAEWHDEWEDFNRVNAYYKSEKITDRGFEDLFDYKEFNGGYSIRKYDDEVDYDW